LNGVALSPKLAGARVGYDITYDATDVTVIRQSTQAPDTVVVYVEYWFDATPPPGTVAFGGGSFGKDALSGLVPTYASNAVAAVYATSGVRYLGVPQAGIGGVPAFLTHQLRSPTDQIARLWFDYAMGSPDSGDVVLDLALFQVSVGGDPDGNPTVFSGLTFTPGADQLLHRLDGAVLSALDVSLLAGQDTYVKISRPIGSGTHPGDLRIINWGIDSM